MAKASETGFDGHRFNLWPGDEWPNRYGSWKDEDPNGKKGTHGIPNYLSGSDYSGSLVERSNVACWCDTFEAGHEQWWTEVGGGHGTFAIVVKVDAMPEEAWEMLCALAQYPLIDEEAHSRMEMEAQDEAWTNWAEKDWQTAVEAVCDLERGALDAGYDLRTLFEAACDRSATYWVNEQGDSMCIDIKRAAEAITDDERAEIIKAAAQADHDT